MTTDPPPPPHSFHTELGADGQPVRPRITAKARDAGIKRVLWIVMGLNIAVAITKLVMGTLAGALSLVADGLHSTLDASSNVVGLIGMAVASRPPDASHPYGHRRFETLTAMAIGLGIAAGMFVILREVWQGLMHGRQPPEVTWVTAAAVALTVVANLGISHYEKKKGTELRSGILQADAAHTMSDALGACSVLASFAGVALGYSNADLIAAVLVAILIGRTAYGILRTNLGVLSDEARLNPYEIRRIAMTVHGVLGAHKIRSRGPADQVLVDLHIHVDEHMTIHRAHEVTHQVIDAIRSWYPEIVDVVIHTEPADGRELDESKIAPPVHPHENAP